MEVFNGYLFSKLQNIGSKSEGVEYSLQFFDYTESRVEKKAELWKEDPNLHIFLNKKVTIEGELSEDRIVYNNIIDYKKP